MLDAPRRYFAHLTLWVPLIVLFFAVVANLALVPVSPTPASVSSSILTGFVFVISGLGASVCWDAYRVRGVKENLLGVGGTLRLLLWLLSPVVIWSLISFAVLWVLTWVQLGLAVPPAPIGVYLALLMCLAWASLAVALAWSIHSGLALVLATALPFTVTSFTWALSNPLWRHMFGVPSGCCSLGGIINADMVLASSLSLGALIIFAIGITVLPRRTIMAAFTLAISAVSWIGSYAVASRVDNFVAAQPRPLAEQVCEEDMCFWPESTEAEIAANRQALALLFQTMPPQWLPPKTAPLTIADSHIYVGNSPEEHINIVPVGSPLNFQNSDNVPDIYARFVFDMALRAEMIDYDQFFPDADFWQRWAETQESVGQSTTEDIREAIAKGLAEWEQMGETK